LVPGEKDANFRLSPHGDVASDPLNKHLPTINVDVKHPFKVTLGVCVFERNGLSSPNTYREWAILVALVENTAIE
jgi:hypothetical protein